jgi:hypothetical protein
MNTQSRDPWQEAADQAGGFEGLLAKHNCKTGIVTLDGAEIGPDFRACLLMETAAHGWLRFEEKKLVEREIRRYAIISPDRNERRPDWEPNTSVLGVSIPDENGVGQLLTYAGAGWGVRKAFEAQLLKPYQRLRRQAFPVVTLSFRAQTDEYGNFLPVFSVVAWRPRSGFASILGEKPPAPQLSARHPAEQRHYLKPQSSLDDVYAGVDPEDIIR